MFPIACKIRSCEYRDPKEKQDLHFSSHFLIRSTSHCHLFFFIMVLGYFYFSLFFFYHCKALAGRIVGSVYASRSFFMHKWYGATAFVSDMERDNFLYSQILISPGLHPGGFVELWVGISLYK